MVKYVVCGIEVLKTIPTNSRGIISIISSAVTLVGGRKQKEDVKMDEKKILADASRAYTFALKGMNGDKARKGGNVLTHKPSCYGVVLKWLIFVRGMTYADFANRYNGTTAQNINHFINRADKARFFDENVDKMCEVLNVTYDYFIEVSKKVQEKMEA